MEQIDLTNTIQLEKPFYEIRLNDPLCYGCGEDHRVLLKSVWLSAKGDHS